VRNLCVGQPEITDGKMVEVRFGVGLTKRRV
jgi:hypothetical protein